MLTDVHIVAVLWSAKTSSKNTTTKRHNFSFWAFFGKGGFLKGSAYAPLRRLNHVVKS
jgi:hypothetical protein